MRTYHTFLGLPLDWYHFGRHDEMTRGVVGALESCPTMERDGGAGQVRSRAPSPTRQALLAKSDQRRGSHLSHPLWATTLTTFLESEGSQICTSSKFDSPNGCLWNLQHIEIIALSKCFADRHVRVHKRYRIPRSSHKYCFQPR